jgi:hypothetical protein
VGLWSLAGRVQNRPASLHARKCPRGLFLAVQARGGTSGCMQREGRETGRPGAIFWPVTVTSLGVRDIKGRLPSAAVIPPPFHRLPRLLHCPLSPPCHTIVSSPLYPCDLSNLAATTRVVIVRLIRSLPWSPAEGGAAAGATSPARLEASSAWNPGFICSHRHRADLLPAHPRQLEAPVRPQRDLLLCCTEQISLVYFLLRSNTASPTRFRYHLIFPRSVVFIFTQVCARCALTAFTMMDQMGTFVPRLRFLCDLLYCFRFTFLLEIWCR